MSDYDEVKDAEQFMKANQQEDIISSLIWRIDQQESQKDALQSEIETKDENNTDLEIENQQLKETILELESQIDELRSSLNGN